MDMGPKRDIMSPLAEACRKRGMKFGFFFSLSEWEYPLLKDGGQLANFSWNKEIPFSKDMEYKASGKIAVKDFVNEYIIPQAAEFIEKYFRQGMRVTICGRIQTGSYTNRDGNKVYTTDVVVEEQEFAESKNAGGSNGGYSAPQHNNPAPSANTSDLGSADGFMNIPDGIDEELPFN